LPVNKLPDDLYFYHYGNKENRLPPPPDKRFVPLKYNQEKVLDVVIGSSTIYPIFSPRALSSVQLGTEAKISPDPPIEEMRIIDGGFIHNIPIQAARLWGATHIIVIDASPAPQMRDPQHLWDNTVMAFGYLFKQAQASDTLERVGTFELRPSSKCEKLNVRAVCTNSEPPDPNLDTFDFSNRAARRAFDKGQADVNQGGPLFVRVPGAPVFRTVSPRVS
jgi:predicted acylesterase/phospholipase RssA